MNLWSQLVQISKKINIEENKIKNVTPNLAFPNHYLNNPYTNTYDQIYSKKKLNLLTDYLGQRHLDRDEYVK